jgi:hypothetical protein
MIRKMVVAAAAALLLCGCASSSIQTGTPIDPAKVSQIQKGTTTKAQVEAMFGPPTGINLMGDGRRMAVYSSYSNTAGAHVTPANFVPVVGMFVPVQGQGLAHMQQLQIIYTAQDVVEDDAFSENAIQTTTSASAFTGMNIQTQSVPVAPPPAAMPSK